MQGFWLEGFVLSKKQLIIDPYFQILAFIILDQLTILDEHLSLIIYVGKQLIIHPYSSSPLFHFLLYVAENVKQSQTVRSGRFESNLLTWPGRPNTHVWEPSHPHDFSPFFPGCGSGSPTSTTRIHATVRRRVVSLLALACGRMKTTFKEGESKVHSPGQSGT